MSEPTAPQPDLLAPTPARWRLGAGLVLVAVWWISMWAAGLVPMHLGGQYLFGGYAAFLVSWLVLGGIGQAWIASGGAALHPDRPDPLTRLLAAGSDRAFVLGGVLAAFALPLLVHVLAIGPADLVDDEDAYRFAGELLAQGRLWADSPPLKLFFDRTFFINDGRWMSQYFIGFPLALVPGVWSGTTAWVNPALAALAVPAIAGVGRRWFGAEAGRLGIVLYATSPLVFLGAALDLSHTACVTGLAWTTWLALRDTDDGAPAWVAPALGLVFGWTFWVRPLSALGIGLPVLVWWAWQAWRSRRVGALAAFTAGAGLVAAAFLAVNHAQHGHPAATGYGHYFAYQQANAFRYSSQAAYDTAVFLDPAGAVGITVIALLRLNLTLLGWPASLLLVYLAPRDRSVGLLWAMVGTYLVTHLISPGPGMDVYGPTHYHELGLPLWWLSLAGFARLRASAEARAAAAPDAVTAAAWRRWAGGVVGVGIVLGALGHAPLRVYTVATMSSQISRPAAALDAAGWHDAIVFVEPMVNRPCEGDVPYWHLGFYRPSPRPDLSDRRVWLNHVNAWADRSVRDTVFPRRRAVVVRRAAGCRFELLDLDDPSATIPDGYVGPSPDRPDGWEPVLEPEYQPPG